MNVHLKPDLSWMGYPRDIDRGFRHCLKASRTSWSLILAQKTCTEVLSEGDGGFEEGGGGSTQAFRALLEGPLGEKNQCRDHH
jgi:hypothetical protein